MDNDLGMLFNNTDIRHYSGTNKAMHAKFKTLSPEKQEEWYDRIYELFLTAILTNNYVDIKNDIKELKNEE